MKYIVVAHPGEYWMKSSLSTRDPWQKVYILKGRSKLPPPTDINLPIMYSSGHPINSNKVSDLQKMVPFLLPSCQQFYTSLFNHPVCNRSDDQD